MKDVALLANVSISTVSHVLNETRTVAPETRSRILEAMRELKYYKNAFGRRLARGRSDAFGLLISDIENPFFPELIKSFERAVVDNGFDVFLCTTNYDKARAASAVRRMIENKVQGVAVMTSQLDSNLVDDLVQNDIPVVLLDSGVVSRLRSNLRADYSRGALEAVTHLRGLGHRNVGFIAGPQTRVSAVTFRQAIVAAIEQTGLVLSQSIEGDNTVEGGRAAMLSLFRQPNLPTAILCGNDLAALGVINALKESGIDVPGQFSVIGADDIAVARYSSPPLTTIRIARDQLGQVAFDALQQLLRSKRRNGVERVIETHLVVRGSTAPPA
jgi:DNA-binding LacI/PurR family transcriptional regulator